MACIQLQMNEGIMGRNDDRTLLLGEHVLDQVAHTVAVAELVVIPADKRWGIIMGGRSVI